MASSGKRWLLMILVFCCAVSGSRAENWPGWRGPTGQGHSADKLPLTWNGKTGANVLWKSALFDDKVQLDHNQSSPIVWGDRVFATLSYWPKGADKKEFPEHHVVCFDKQTGKKLWDTKVAPGDWLLKDLRGGYTAPTPASDGEHVYVVFGSACIAALDFTGKIAWHRKFDHKNIDVAIGTSPVLHGDNILYVCDKNNRASKLWAFNRKTGKLEWEKARPGGAFTHSTPILADFMGKKQLLVAASKALQGVDPANGNILWSGLAKGDTASPVCAEGIAFCDSGRGGIGCAFDAASIGASKTNLKWTIPQIQSGFSSPIIVGDLLYRLHNPSVLSCWELKTGKPVFNERLPISTTSASPIATPDGRIYLASSGKSVVIQAGPKLKVLASNDLGDPHVASPAAADGMLILKGQRFLFCVGTK